MYYFWAVVIIIALIALGYVFGASEIAVIALNESQIEDLSERGGKYARAAERIKKLTKNPEKFLAATQFCVITGAILCGSVAAIAFAERVANAVIAAGAGAPYTLWLIIFGLVFAVAVALLYMVFASLVPRRVAMKHTEEVAVRYSGAALLMTYILKPLVFLVTAACGGVCRLFKIKPEESVKKVTEEEIIKMAEAGSEKGSIESEENQMIKNIFDFNDLTVGEVCTHRKDADILYKSETDAQWEKTIFSTNHTFYPVCGENVDDVTGVLYTKAYFRLKDKSRASVTKNAVRPPMFVYENEPANSVFNKMKTRHEYFAVVIDEYGGMAGIVSLHDLLEIIVGDMDEKGEKADYVITQKGDNLWEITGFAPIGKVEDALDITFPEEVEETYETFGGYVCGLHGSLPEDGSKFEIETDKLHVKVLRVEKRCITKVEVSLIVNDEDKEEE